MNKSDVLVFLMDLTISSMKNERTLKILSKQYDSLKNTIIDTELKESISGINETIIQLIEQDRDIFYKYTNFIKDL